MIKFQEEEEGGISPLFAMTTNPFFHTTDYSIVSCPIGDLCEICEEYKFTAIARELTPQRKFFGFVIVKQSVICCQECFNLEMLQSSARRVSLIKHQECN